MKPKADDREEILTVTIWLAERPAAPASLAKISASIEDAREGAR